MKSRKKQEKDLRKNSVNPIDAKKWSIGRDRKLLRSTTRDGNFLSRWATFSHRFGLSEPANGVTVDKYSADVRAPPMKTQSVELLPSTRRQQFHRSGFHWWYWASFLQTFENKK